MNINQLSAFLSVGIFVILPPGLLLARHKKGKKMPWWLIVILIIGAGWLLVNATNYFYGEYVCELAKFENSSEGHIRACYGDGARNVFTFLFGWLYSIIYSVPFFVVYFFAKWIEKRRKEV